MRVPRLAKAAGGPTQVDPPEQLGGKKRLELECEGGPPVASALVVVCDLALEIENG